MSREVARRDAAQRVGVAGAGEQRGRADEHLVVGPAREVDAEERAGRGRARGRRARARGRGARAQAQPRAAEGDDARVGLAARRRPRAGPTSRRRRRRRSARRVSPAAWRTRMPLGRRLDALDRAAGDDLAARGAHVVGERARRSPRKSTTPVCGRVQRLDAAHVRLDLGDLLRRRRGAGRGRRWRVPRRSSSSRRGRSSVARRDDQLAVTRGRAARAPRSSRRARARPRCTGGP